MLDACKYMLENMYFPALLSVLSDNTGLQFLKMSHSEGRGTG